jgi:hypothetical protein
MPHREVVNERRFPEWIVCNTDAEMIMCPRCLESFIVKLAFIRASMSSTDLRPCPYCWGLNRIR